MTFTIALPKLGIKISRHLPEYRSFFAESTKLLPQEGCREFGETGGVPAPEVVDRPSTTPVSRLQALLDPTVMVRLGFKVRPLRDGGGKPSPGRSPPPLRKPAPSLVELGKKILQLATNVVDKVIESIHRQDKHHPFPPDLLEQVRSLVPGSNQDTPFDGQPFFLDHLRSMAEMAGDPDFQYFEILKTGV